MKSISVGIALELRADSAHSIARGASHRAWRVSDVELRERTATLAREVLRLPNETLSGASGVTDGSWYVDL